MVFKFGEFIFEKKDNTYLKSVIEILKTSENPLTVEEICDLINQKGINQIPKDSYRSVSSTIISYTKGKENLKTTKERNKSGKTYFEEIKDGNLAKYKLINEIEEPFVKPTEPTEKSIEKSDEDSVGKLRVFKKNPFRQSVCVLGEPGVGKSVTIRNILRKAGHKFQIWEPTAATTGLLSQFSPSESGYIPSKIGKMLINASQDPQNLYTFVLDEFHKSSVIEMVNDELKHAISLRRYEGDRFISLEDSTSYLSKYLDEDDGGNLKVPDNFGFIFISSKPRVIANNGDIFDRVDLVVLKHHEEEKIQSVDELLSKVLSPEEKRRLSSTRTD